jgi:hypothetical protein
VSHWIKHISCKKLNVETLGCRRGLRSWNTIDALHAISQWPDGVAALANIGAFEELQHLYQDDPHLHKLRDNITRYKAGKPDSSTHEGVDS